MVRPSFSWISLVAPLALSAVMFFTFRSPFALVIAGTTPGIMVLSYWLKLRSETRRFTRQTVEFDDSVGSFIAATHEAHERERVAAVKQSDPQSLLGFAPHPSRVAVDGQPQTTRLRKLKADVEINPKFPVFLPSPNQESPSALEILFEGNIATQIRHRFEVITTGNALPHPQDSAPSASLAIRRFQGELSLPNDVPLTLRLMPRGIVQSRASITRIRSVRLAELGERSNARTELRAEVGIDERGRPVEFDLVHDGPHLLVAGTTGSGKSELLRTVIAQLALRYPPQSVQFLLVDFKGGASLQHLDGLPHVLELLSDLQPAQVNRAVLALTAEIRRREQVLRDVRRSDIRELDVEQEMPRLVIVVDEFATLVHELPELHAVFTDVAARGRALGLHLIVATQRPAGVVRDALVANCSLRLCLRVSNAQESFAVLGSAIASRLSARQPGGCVHAHNGFVSAPWNVRLTSSSELQRVVESAAPHPNATPYWLPPLPTTIWAKQLPAAPPGNVHLGVADQPERQRQSIVTISAQEHGVVLVLGSQRSGKTQLCETFAQQWSAQQDRSPTGVVFLEGDGALLWDVLFSSRHRNARAGDRSSTLWLFDDLDVAVSQLGAEHAQAVAHEFGRFLQSRPSGDLVVATLGRLPALFAQTFTATSHRFHLAAANKEQHIAWGLPSASYRPKVPSGRGWYQGFETQIALSDSTAPRTGHEVGEMSPTKLRAVVSSRREFWREVTSHESGGAQLIVLDSFSASARDLVDGGEEHPRVILGCVDDWSNHAALLQQCRAQAEFVFDQVSPAEIRQITRQAKLPPPVVHPDELLVWRQGEEFNRVRRVHHQEP